VTETASGRNAKKVKKLAQQAIDALMELKKAADTARERGEASMSAWAAGRGLRYLEAAARVGAQATAARSGPLERKHLALFTRIRDRFTDYPRWVGDLRLPFDNNAAEQTIRMPKLRIKVSGSMRTLAGRRSSPRSGHTPPPPAATAGPRSTSSSPPCAASPGRRSRPPLKWCN
jgi:hypothetical protein